MVMFNYFRKHEPKRVKSTKLGLSDHFPMACECKGATRHQDPSSLFVVVVFFWGGLFCNLLAFGVLVFGVLGCKIDSRCPWHGEGGGWVREYPLLKKGQTKTYLLVMASDH